MTSAFLFQPDYSATPSFHSLKRKSALPAFSIITRVSEVVLLLLPIIANESCDSVLTVNPCEPDQQFSKHAGTQDLLKRLHLRPLL